MATARRVIYLPSLRTLRIKGEALLHVFRRRRAYAALRRRPRPTAVLVVCHGNICRSPFAAARLARELRTEGVLVESAGFLGPARPCPPEAVKAAARRGEDLSTHRSALLAPDVVRTADLIVVMEPGQGRAISERFGRLPSDIVVLGDLDPVPLALRTIRDPIEQSLDVYAETYARIERCVAALVGALGVAPRAGATAGMGSL